MEAREVTAFTLDTSGHVGGSPLHMSGRTYWRDLDPFTQGYIEALFSNLAQEKVDLRCAELGEEAHGDIGAMLANFAFSDLAPETLAAILKDTAAEREVQNVANSRYSGTRFWQLRQDGRMGRLFRPLTPYLGDDGKVYLREDPQ